MTISIFSTILIMLMLFFAVMQYIISVFQKDQLKKISSLLEAIFFLILAIAGITLVMATVVY